jgi:hypothetical protein
MYTMDKKRSIRDFFRRQDETCFSGYKCAGRLRVRIRFGRKAPGFLSGGVQTIAVGFTVMVLHLKKSRKDRIFEPK